MPTYVDPGFSDHAHGRLAHIVRGAERAAAHEQIMRLMGASEQAGIAEWVRRDPSLFIEPIPRFHPVSGDEADSWDRAWQKHTNWLDKAAAGGGEACIDAVIAVLEAGIHPEDTTAFRSDVLLGFFQWRSKPELLATALKHGAGADMPPERHSRTPRSLVYRVVTWMQPLFASTSLKGDVQDLKERIACANMLLDAGAKLMDPVMNPAPRTGRATPTGIVSTLGVLCNPWYEGSAPWLKSSLESLVRRLVAHGADLDVATGMDELPPVVRAIRNRNRPMALLLIELGCKTDDADIVRLGDDEFTTPKAERSVKSVIEEAGYHVGSDFAAEVTEAIMRVRMSRTPVLAIPESGRVRRAPRV